MRRHTRTLALSLILILSYGFACGSSNAIKSFRLALASSGPLVNSLVAAGAIPGSRATAIIADFDAGAQCGLILQEEFAAIPKDAANARSLKLAASQKAFKCFRVIIDRQNFAAHPRLQQVANIADGILASLVIFYGDGAIATAIESEALSRATIRAKTEADLERQMNSQMKALEEAMKP